MLREIRIRYKQAVLGFGWAILMPLLIVMAGFVVRLAMAQLSGGTIDRASILGVARANPMLTIVAMGIRLADEVKARI